MGDYTATRSINMEAAINGTHEFAYDNEASGPFSYSTSDPDGGEALSWHDGTGKLWHLEDDGATGFMIIELLTGNAPDDGDTITGGASSATCDVNGTPSAVNQMSSGDNLTVNYGVTVTQTQTAGIMFGTVSVYGTYHVDGLNITNGSIIAVVGDWVDSIKTYNTGTFKVTGDWLSLGNTTGDNHSIDLSTATGLGVYDNGSGDHCVDSIVGCWVETGRRIDYDAGTGVLPEVDDMVYDANDYSVYGRILEVHPDAPESTGYLVVQYLTGTLVNDDSIEVRKIIDNGGPDYQISWTASVNNVSGDIKESGVYQGFGNCATYDDSLLPVDKRSTFGTTAGGFIFLQEWKTTTMTFASAATGGFVPPSGCDVKIPNVHIISSDATAYATGNGVPDIESFTSRSGRRYDVDTSNSGNVDLSICNFGSSYCKPYYTVSFTSEYVCADILFGVVASPSRVTMDNVIIAGAGCVARVSYPWTGYSYWSTVLESLPNGADLTNSLVIVAVCMDRRIGAFRSSNVYIANCIWSCGYDYYSWIATKNNRGFYFDTTDNSTVLNSIAYHGGSTNTYNAGGLSISTCNDMTIVNFRYSQTQQGTPASAGLSGSYLISSSGINLYNFQILESGSPNGSMYSATNLRDSLISCHGMIDEPVDYNSLCNYVASLDSYCYGVTFSRVFATNIQFGIFLSTDNTCGGTRIINSGSDYDSLLYPSSIDGTLFKGAIGGRAVNSTSYWKSTRVSGTGYTFHDGMCLPTSGVIAIMVGIKPGTVGNDLISSSGTYGWDNNGELFMNSGAQLVFEQSYWMQGYTAFSGDYATDIGNATLLYDNWTKEWSGITLEFQYKFRGGDWNGSWLSFDTASNWTGIDSVGDPETGIKFKVRLTATSDEDEMSAIFVDATTSISDMKANLYDLELYEVTVSNTNLADGTRVWLTNETENETIDNSVVSGGAGYSLDKVEVHVGDVIRMRATYNSGTTYYDEIDESVVASGLDMTFIATQTNNTVLNTWAIDGSAQTDFTADYPNVEVDIDSGDVTKKALASWVYYTNTTADGIVHFFGAITIEDAGNIRINVDVVDLRIDYVGTGNSRFTDNDVRIYRSDDSNIFGGTGDNFASNSGRVYVDTADVESSLTVIDGKIDTIDGVVDGIASDLSIVDSIVNSILEDTATTIPATLTSILNAIDAVPTAVWSEDISSLTGIEHSAAYYLDYVRFLDGLAIFYDADAPAGGDGSNTHPFNTVGDAMDLAEAKNLKKLVFKSAATLDRNLKNFEIYGVGVPAIDLNGYDIKGTKFRYCTLTGAYIDFIIAQECVLANGFHLHGFFERCAGSGIAYCDTSTPTLVANCYTMGHDFTISVSNGGGVDLMVANFSGDLIITDASHADTHVDVIGEGKVVVDSSCVDGDIHIRGTINVTDNSGPNCEVIDYTVTQEVVKTRRISGNKMTMTNADGGTPSQAHIWDDDGANIIYTFDLKDIEGKDITIKAGVIASRGVLVEA